MKCNYLGCMIIGIVAIQGCSHKAATCNPNSKLDSLKSLSVSQAIGDADLAFTHGDKRLLGVYSVAIEVPGLPGNPDSYRYGIKPIEGTSDTICSDQERALNDNARSYAKKYNQEIMSQLQKAGG